MAENPRLGPQLKKLLESYGLSSLEGWASRMILNDASEEEIMLQLYERAEFKSRFPGIFERQSKGYPPISVDEYLAYEKSAFETAAAFGIGISRDEINDFIGRNIALPEVQERLTIGAQAFYAEAQEVREELGRLYGVTAGQMAKYWLDPDIELPVLQRQFTSGEIAGAARRAGYPGYLTVDQAERLYKWGYDRDKAIEGFGQLRQMGELFTPIDAGEDEITQAEQVEFLAGDAGAAERIQGRQRRRVAEFEGGGGFATSEEGVSGLANI